MHKKANTQVTTSVANTKLYGNGESPEILIVPGFSEQAKIFGRMVDELEQRDYSVAVLQQPKRSRKGSPANGVDRLGRIVSEVTGTLSRSEQRIVLVGHSLGAAAVLRAAAENPEHVSGVILLQPAGATGPESLGQQMNHANRKTLKNLTSKLSGLVSSKADKEGRYTGRVDTEPRIRTRGRIALATLHSGIAIGKNPRLALSEAKAAGQYDLNADIQAVAERGIPIHIVGSNADEMFDTALVNASLDMPVMTTDQISYTQVADPRAPHDDPWIHPARSAEIISQILGSNK